MRRPKNKPSKRKAKASPAEQAARAKARQTRRARPRKRRTDRDGTLDTWRDVAPKISYEPPEEEK